MSDKTIYVLHKHGSPSHYTGLKKLLEQNNYKLKHREFSIATKIYKSIVKLDGRTFIKQFINLSFFLKLFFTKNQKIVLGIAPFDKKLGNLLTYLKHHKVYYHTSWTNWDQTFHPNTKGNSVKVFEIWRQFLEVKVKHIFTVTQKSKDDIIKNYDIQDNSISVVYHALSNAFSSLNPITIKDKLPNSFIYYGRMIPEKGIKELLEYFKRHTNANLTLIGKGKESDLAKKYANEYNNISFKYYTSDKAELISILKKHQYLILNSKRSKTWEELFGLVIIEAMSQGVVPIAANHSGPKEIINPDIGYLFEEGELSKRLDFILDKETYHESKVTKVIEYSKKYDEAVIANHWQAILK